MSKVYTFYTCAGSDAPYRRTPGGNYEQYSNQAGGWISCRQNDLGLQPIGLSDLPTPARSRAYARPVG